MKLLFELSKEHTTLPKAEVLACLQAEKIDYSIIQSTEDVIIIDANIKKSVIKRLADRLSLTFYIDKLLFSCSPSTKNLLNHATSHPVRGKGSIAIDHKNRSNSIDSQPIIKLLADVYAKDRIVNLEKPDICIRVLITDMPIVYVGSQIERINRKQFEERKVQHRPFFSPISLHPKLARTLVNLSLIKKDKTLLDPFCGTGGILLEAGLIGARILGSDIEKKMIEGCKKTFEFYNIKNYSLFCSDIGDIKKNIDAVDAIVTDLPYGRSTTTKGETVEKLYERAIKNIYDVLKNNGRAVIGSSNKDVISIGKKYFSLVEKHEIKVHRSLTRYFAVYQK